MSGPADDGSGWTVRTLFVHFDALITALKVHVIALIAEADRRYQQDGEAQKEAVRAALQAAKEAVHKAELSVDKRLELLNELRAGVATTEQLEALEKVVAELADRLNRAEGRGAGLSAGWGYLLAALGAVATVIAVITTLN